MLQCLVVALRPLHVEEFAELLAFEFKGQGTVPKYRTDWRPDDQVEAVLSTCSSLISIVDDNDFQVVQFSHFSVKEFLMSNRLGDFSHFQILPRPAHTILAQACLGCLLHLDGHVDKDIAKGFPLAEYAARHWVAHAQFEDVASCVKDGMETLFDSDKPHFGAWLGIYNMDEESSSEPPSKIPTPLYYSSLCGFSDLVEHLSTKHPQQVNATGGKYKFSLLAALVGKHVKVAGILLKHGANVNVHGLRERTPLHEAIANIGMVQSLLNKGADVNCRQDDLRTPLHLAAHCGELKVARVLVDHKADVDSQDHDGKTPLQLLLEEEPDLYDDNSILDFAQLLLEHSADTNIRARGGLTLLHAAAFFGRLEVTILLLDHGTNPNAESEQGDTPLHLVSQGEYNSEEHGVGIARLLLERGVDVNARTKDLITPLHSAAFFGRLEIAQLLLDKGADMNAADKLGGMALHMVSRGKYDSQEQGVGIARLLLERGVDVNAQQKDNWTSLHWAAITGKVEVAQVLFDHGANAKLETDHGETALHVMSRCKYDSQEQGASTARLLLEHGVDVNARKKNSLTSLHEAAFRGSVEVAQVLLDHGANAKLETDHGETVLHVVSRGEYDSQEQGARTAQLLLERGVDVNARKKNSFTSLHEAAFRGNIEVARVLLDHGANAELETEAGETALHVVSRGKYDSQEQGVGIARLLLERGADVNARRKDSLTSLHEAAFKGRVEIVQVLFDHGADAKLETEPGVTALHMVSLGEYDSQEQGASTARLLLERGVDVNARKKDSLTSLHEAAFRGNVEVARVLLDYDANANLETDYGETALHMVSRGKYDSKEQGAATARLLLECGVDVNARKNGGLTSLHEAAFNRKAEVTQVLLDHGANALLKTEGGETALHMASLGKYDSDEQGTTTARLLLECGVDVNARKNGGFTSLHEAAFRGEVDVTQFLLNHGANAKLATDHGETALHIVSRGEYDSEEDGVGIARLLLEHGVDVDVQTKTLNTALHSAAFYGRLEITQILLSRGANPNTENEQGMTPLHQVSRGNKPQEHGVEVARLLLEHGVDVDGRAKNRATPLHGAAYYRKLEIVQVRLYYYY